MDLKQHRAAEAERLLNEPLLAEAFATVRANAMNALVEVNPTDADEIRRLQAIASSLQELRDLLYAEILASGRMDGGMGA